MPYVCTGCGADADEHDPPCPECGSDSFVRILGAGEGSAGSDGTVRWRCESCGRLHRRDRLSCEHCASTELGSVAVAPVSDGGRTASKSRDGRSTAASLLVHVATSGAAAVGAWLVVDGAVPVGLALLAVGAAATPTLRRAVRRRLGAVTSRP